MLASNTRDTNPSYSAYYDINGDATINATDLTTKRVSRAACRVPPRLRRRFQASRCCRERARRPAISRRTSAGDFPSGDTVTYTVSGEPTGVTGSFSSSVLSLGIANTYTGTANLTIQATGSGSRVVSAPWRWRCSPGRFHFRHRSGQRGRAYTLNLTPTAGHRSPIGPSIGATVTPARLPAPRRIRRTHVRQWGVCKPPSPTWSPPRPRIVAGHSVPPRQSV